MRWSAVAAVARYLCARAKQLYGGEKGCQTLQRHFVIMAAWLRQSGGDSRGRWFGVDVSTMTMRT